MVLTNCALPTLRIAGSSKNGQMSRPLNRVPEKVGYPSINQLIGVDWMPARKRTAVRSWGLPANKFYLFCPLLIPIKCIILSTFFFGILVIIILLVQMSFSDCKLEEKNTLQNFPPCSIYLPGVQYCIELLNGPRRDEYTAKCSQA